MEKKELSLYERAQGGPTCEICEEDIATLECDGGGGPGEHIVLCQACYDNRPADRQYTSVREIRRGTYPGPKVKKMRTIIVTVTEDDYADAVRHFAKNGLGRPMAAIHDIVICERCQHPAETIFFYQDETGPREAYFCRSCYNEVAIENGAMVPCEICEEAEATKDARFHEGVRLCIDCYLNEPNPNADAPPSDAATATGMYDHDDHN